MHYIHIDNGASVSWHKCIRGSKYAKSGKRSGKAVSNLGTGAPERLQSIGS